MPAPTRADDAPRSLAAELARLGLDPARLDDGLDEADAARRLAAAGANELAPARRRALAAEILHRLASPLLAILILASVVSGLAGDLANAGIVLAIVALSTTVELVQTRRSERAALGLRARVAHTATVRRAGAWREVPRAGVVPGDLVRLVAGDLVPADACLRAARDLHVNEASLTGESLPAEKEAAPADAPAGPRHRVLLGASVVSGDATAVVVATGRATALGGIALALGRRPPPTEFERGLARFGAFILEVVVFLVLFVFVVSAALHRPPLESLLFAVALAVGLTPEFLPMITTVTLARGALRMARARVIVKNLAAIQNVGSMDVLCCDKTGTLTTGALDLAAHLDPVGAPSERPLVLAYLNSALQTGVDNGLDAAVLRRARRDPIEAAVLRHDHPDVSGYRKLDELPFDFERRRVSVVAARGDRALLVTKGAPEAVLAACSDEEVGGATRPLDAAARARVMALCDALGEQGYRVLAVAAREAAPRAAYAKADERDLVLAGLLAFADPVRPDARAVLAELRAGGVELKVLTGDSERVARHVCAEVGIAADEALRGDELDAMSDPALVQRARRTAIFARVTPAQKTRILHALRAGGHVVGFLGDGINDAPSLHAADVGVSVASATDVAREAADLVLLEPGLGPLAEGVREGRRAYGNIMKYLLMGTSSSFGNMFSMAGAALLLPFLPMLPQQILLGNFLYDLAQLTIPTDDVDPALLRAPRRWDVGTIRRFMLWIGPISSAYDFLTFYVLRRAFAAGAGPAVEAAFHTGWFVESLATQALVIFVIRTAGNPLRSRPSRALVATTAGVVAAGIALPFTAPGRWLGLVPLPATYFAFLAGAVATYLLLVELVKRRVFRRELGAA